MRDTGSCNLVHVQIRKVARKEQCTRMMMTIATYLQTWKGDYYLVRRYAQVLVIN